MTLFEPVKHSLDKGNARRTHLVLKTDMTDRQTGRPVIQPTEMSLVQLSTGRENKGPTYLSWASSLG